MQIRIFLSNFFAVEVIHELGLYSRGKLKTEMIAFEIYNQE